MRSSTRAIRPTAIPHCTICVEQRDATWIRFLLGRGADANLVNRADVTPLLAAAQIGFVEGAQALVVGGARVNQSNRRGETALHLAVQRRDIAMVRALIAAGANADLADSVTGNSARDYARADPRATAILAALDLRATATATTGINLQTGWTKLRRPCLDTNVIPADMG